MVSLVTLEADQDLHPAFRDHLVLDLAKAQTGSTAS